MTQTKYDSAYWQKEIRRSIDDRADFRKEADHANKVYEGKGDLDGVSRRINCFWAYIQTVLPAFVSNLPTVEAKLRKYTGSDLYTVGAILLERNVDYANKEHFEFGKVATHSILQWLIAGQGVLWARYQPEIARKVVDYAENEEQEDGTTRIIEKSKEVDWKRGEKAILESISYNDFLYQICPDPEQIAWKGRRAYLTYSEVKEKFGQDLAEELDYNITPKTNDRTEKAVYEGKTELKEIWCEPSGKVYWCADGKDNHIVEAGDPPVRYAKFFPCAVIDGYLPLNSVIPRSDYTQNKDIILEIERLVTRKHYAIQSVRFNATYDPVLKDTINKIFSTDYEMFPNPNWTAYQKTGGLAGGVHFFDPTMYTNAVKFLGEEIEMQLRRFYDNTGASDLIRGATNPLETATAQQLKSNYSSLRFSVRQKQVYEFINEAENLLAEIIGEQFSPKTILETADLQDIQAKYPGVNPVEVVAMLKSDERRRYRIEITSDSLTQLDERQDRAERIDFIQSAGGFLTQMKDLVTTTPSAVNLASQMLDFVLKSYKAGKDLTGQFKQTFNQMTQEALKAQQNGQNDPRVAIEQQKLQIAQTESQLKQQQMQINAQISQMNAQIENTRLSLEAGKQQFEQQYKTQELGIKAQESQLKYAVDTEKLKIEAAKISQKTETEAINAELKAIQEKFNQQLQAAYLKLDEFAVVSKENEKLIEEKRLASQERIETLRVISEQISKLSEAKSAKQSEGESKAPGVVIHNHIPKSGGKRIQKSENGIWESREIEDADEGHE